MRQQQLMAAVKLEKASIDRLALSTRVIAGWEAMGGPLGSPADLLRMIDGEIATLTRLRDQAPTQVDDQLAPGAPHPQRVQLHVTSWRGARGSLKCVG